MRSTLSGCVCYNGSVSKATTLNIADGASGYLIVTAPKSISASIYASQLGTFTGIKYDGTGGTIGQAPFSDLSEYAVVYASFGYQNGKAVYITYQN